ncbi:MAG: serine protease [Methylotenera sp.]|nr:MAG: serine protease [Methylotenera sp.]
MIKHNLTRIYTLSLLMCVASVAWAMPAEELVSELSHSVLRVKVKLPNGGLGLGSAVVVGKNEVITNCHVVNDATNVSVIVNGEPHSASAIKADWHHDLCMLTVENLDVPAVKFGISKNLQYDESVFTVGYPGETESPVSTFGIVNGLFPMDDSVIIRASSPFKLGASGGGAFDDAGNLVGIITLKSKGNVAHYFYMPVEWVQALMGKPAQSLGAKSEKPFWAMTSKQRPYFMQVVQPYVTQEWKTLFKVAIQWVQAEPNTAESWFYLATAEFATQDYVNAEEHFKKVLAINNQHSQAIDYLEKLAQKTANSKVALLN